VTTSATAPQGPAQPGIPTKAPAEAVPFWLAGRPVTAGPPAADRPASGPAADATAATADATTFDVHNPWNGEHLATVSVPTDAQVEEAVAAAAAARHEFAATPAHVRAAALDHVAARLAERAEELARLITAENGKPVKWARGEVGRAVSVFRWAAEEARRWNSGEAQRLDTDPGGTGRLALTRRFGRGPVLGIAPFNFPLNLVAHKIAPALAVGVPIIVKPAPATPLSALVLGEILAETSGLPAGSWSVLPVPNDRMPALVRDPRLPVISFTGSDTVGYEIMDAVPRKHVTLELGGNAAAVVLADWSSEQDLDWAASRIATFANYQGGQSCISVQRVIADAAVYDALADKVVAKVRAQVTGDPGEDATDVGPLVSLAAAERVEAWVADAVAKGARVLTGGTRDGASYEPTVLADLPADAILATEEAFGPVLSLHRVDGADEAFAAVNDSRFGLQTGVFTHDLRTAFRAHRELEVGGVVIGDAPSYRADQMPYGGVKDSGTGREGVRYAMDDYTYERVLILTGLDL
jgi:acyl-CoA reductase-like NAD-dependent aldehyde dehydrogenase